MIIYQQYEIPDMVLEGFSLLANEIKKMKYPMTTEKDIILSSIDNALDVKFNIVDVQTAEPVLKPLLYHLKNLLKQSNASIIFENDYVFKDVKQREVYAFTSKHGAIGGMAFTMTGYKQFGRYCIQISVSCSYEKKEQAIDLFKNVSLAVQKNI